MSTSPPGSRGLRISDADRARAAERLQVAMAEGRITMAELEERLAVVYGARYEGELVPPLADLPGPEPAGAPVPAVASGPATVLRAGMSTIKRTGAWSVPAAAAGAEPGGLGAAGLHPGRQPAPGGGGRAGDRGRLGEAAAAGRGDRQRRRPAGRARRGQEPGAVAAPGRALRTSWCAAGAAWARWSCADVAGWPTTSPDRRPRRRDRAGGPSPRRSARRRGPAARWRTRAARR